MINYTFKSNSDSATKKVAEFIEGFIPKIDFQVERGHFGLEITCQFIDENQKDSFIATLNESLDVSESGEYIG